MKEGTKALTVKIDPWAQENMIPLNQYRKIFSQQYY